jgi:hypothetical protein
MSKVKIVNEADEQKRRSREALLKGKAPYSSPPNKGSLFSYQSK